ncbi:cyclin-dependent kinase 11B isoform X1 [Hydra vulgaris]|uniref:cyclin-dependent kinase 11B isoform X1 n=1 Tax=Hydra vulgaris TaxID=6087 RepID=UPI001F5EA426|nr:cyclin-dependent kinase 11B [Hydra vulgaris]
MDRRSVIIVQDNVKSKIPFLEVDLSPSPPKRTKHTGHLKSTIQRPFKKDLAEEGEILSSPEPTEAEVVINPIMSSPEDIFASETKLQKVEEEKKLLGVSEDYKKQTVLSHKKILSDDSDRLSDHLETSVRSRINTNRLHQENYHKEKSSYSEEHRSSKIYNLYEDSTRKRPYNVSDERKNRSDSELLDHGHFQKYNSNDLIARNVKQKDETFKKVKSEVRKKEKKYKKSEEKYQKKKKSKRKLTPEKIQHHESVKLEKSPSMDYAFIRKNGDIEPITSDSSLDSFSRSPSKSPTPLRSRSPSQSPTLSDNRSDSESPSPLISRSPTPKLSPPPQRKRTYLPAIEGCRSVEEFTWLNRIEEGTYGVVYRARDRRTDEVVALKRLKMEREKEGFPITSLREINCLLKAQHPNIVTVREIVVGNNTDKIYIVMDYVEHDLKSLMETMTQPFLVGEVKTLMLQLLRGVRHMHDNWILHRDIKTSNLLLSHKGILKIGDFGLAREYGSPLKKYTSIVVTLWYRAPELLLGTKEYSTAIDLWSCGCVFAELLTMKALFPGKSEIDQISRIFKELGTPNDKIWPGPPAYSEMPQVQKMNISHHHYNILRQRFGATLTDIGFDLMNRLLTYDPGRRITADDAMAHAYFKESPLPVDSSMFPTWPAKSELGHKAMKKNASPKPPEGGQFNEKLGEDSGFQMNSATKGSAAKGMGFSLKF